jgi:hypothetical protein
MLLVHSMHGVHVNLCLVNKFTEALSLSIQAVKLLRSWNGAVTTPALDQKHFIAVRSLSQWPDHTQLAFV